MQAYMEIISDFTKFSMNCIDQLLEHVHFIRFSSMILAKLRILVVLNLQM